MNGGGLVQYLVNVYRLMMHQGRVKTTTENILGFLMHSVTTK